MAASDRLIPADVSSARVTLEVYSGRDDPTWGLPKELIAELTHRLAALSAAKAPGAAFDGLGYRGVRVELKDKDGAATTVEISRGIAAVNRDGQQSQFDDPGRRTEAWLVNTGVGKIPADVLQYVTKEVGAPPR
jgi:hypothetical protein